MQLVSQASSRFQSRRTVYSEQSDQHELSRIAERSKFNTGVKSSTEHILNDYHIEGAALSTRSEESILPTHNNTIRKTTTVKLDRIWRVRGLGPMIFSEFKLQQMDKVLQVMKFDIEV